MGATTHAPGSELREASRDVLMQVLRANNASTREERAVILTNSP
ncbi:MAG: hypothetical protein OEL91_05000 [Burkholderiaceae bacterium]|nr:hypothetical protein [Burkholderiaceae bacterium]